MVWEHIEGEDVGDWLQTQGAVPAAARRRARHPGAARARGDPRRRRDPSRHLARQPDDHARPPRAPPAEDHRPRPGQEPRAPAGARDHPGRDVHGQAHVLLARAGGSCIEGRDRSTTAATSTRSPRCSTRWSPACRRSTRRTSTASSSSGSPSRRCRSPAATRGCGCREELDRVVLRGLERDREKRFPDAHRLPAGAGAGRRRSCARWRPRRSQVPARAAAAARCAGAAGSASRPASRAARPRELSREERIDLLAQIDRAAKKVNEASRLAELARQAFAARRYDDAAGLVTQLESVAPRNPAVAELKEQLAEVGKALSTPPASPAAAASPVHRRHRRQRRPLPRTRPAEPHSRHRGAGASSQPRRRCPPPAARGPRRAGSPVPAEPSAEERERAAKIAEAERLLDKYLQENSQSLASFALETLVELDPHHPRRDLFASADQDHGRGARRDGDCRRHSRGGRRTPSSHGDLVARAPQARAAREGRPDDAARRGAARAIRERRAAAATDAALGRRRDRLESLLDSHRLEEAERELAAPLGRRSRQGLGRDLPPADRRHRGSRRARRQGPGVRAPLQGEGPGAGLVCGARRRPRLRALDPRQPAPHAALQRDQPARRGASQTAGDRTGRAAARDFPQAEEARRGRAGASRSCSRWIRSTRAGPSSRTGFRASRAEPALPCRRALPRRRLPRS